jgi:hypothetical protein
MLRRWTAPLLLVLATACTGTAPPPDAEPSAREKPSASAPAVAAPATAAKPAVDATTEVLQLALDVAEMDGFWHIDVRPDRVPLKIAPHAALPESVALVKFGRPVVVESGAPLRFETIVVDAADARVAYRYDPEGVSVDVRLQHDGTRWRVVNASAAEH